MRIVENDKSGKRLTGRVRADRAENGGLRIDLNASDPLKHLVTKDVLGVAIVRLNGDVVTINDYYLTQILGYTRKEFETNGLNLIAITAGDATEDAEKLLEQFRSTGKINVFERMRYRRDGNVVWTLQGYAAVDGNPDLLATFALDITEKKRAEITSQYLLEANKIMASSVELQPLLEKIVAVTLVNGFCDFCTIHLPDNEDRLVCRALIHKDPDLTRQVKRIIERYPRYLSDAIGPARVIRTGKAEMSCRPSSFETGSSFAAIGALALKSYISVPLNLGEKTIGALTLTSLTRTFDPEDLKTAEALALRASQHIENAKLHEELKASKAELERSNRDLTYYASIAAHDLKSPLATAQSYLNLLLEEGGHLLNEEHRSWLRRAISSNKKLLSQVDRFLTFSHSNIEQIDLQNISLTKPVHSAMESLNSQIIDAGARFSFGALPTVTGDATLLTLLFQNLFSNSIRYRNLNRQLRIKIKAEPGPNGWTVHVSDNGNGFDENEAERIFRLFERLPQPAINGGHGIGLATCRKIIEAHNGQIWAKSTPGEGAKFSFTLPG